jgi:hypothetical protein
MRPGGGPAGSGVPANIRRPQFTLPTGWSEAPMQPFAVVTLAVSENGQTAVTTISPLPGGGGITRNINRWRMQVGLPEEEPEEIAGDLKAITIDGIEGHFVDLLGPDGANRQRILGAICSRNNTAWFFKMIGPADLVAKQRQAFETFVKSVRFEGAAP